MSRVARITCYPGPKGQEDCASGIVNGEVFSRDELLITPCATRRENGNGNGAQSL
jgi:hypothetical protein